LYVVWKGNGGGRAELDEAMRRFGEVEYVDSATPAEHFELLMKFLMRHGFEEIRS
jgi:hypothetical protein